MINLQVREKGFNATKHKFRGRWRTYNIYTHGYSACRDTKLLLGGKFVNTAYEFGCMCVCMHVRRFRSCPVARKPPWSS